MQSSNAIETRSQSLKLPHGELRLPVFLPDATRGVLRTVDTQDVRGTGISGLQMNVFHLMQQPGSYVIRALGGLHNFCAWDGPIITDSGGFQVYSLIRQNSKYGSINRRGIHFNSDSGRKYNLTPEKSIQLQMAFGADIVVCLDDCTHADESLSEQKSSVQRTLEWGKKCKLEFERIIQERTLSENEMPKIFAVIQGGAYPELRRECAEGLLEVGFDGYAYGGWPMDGEGNLLTDMLALTRELVPSEYPVHALGVGKPSNIAACIELGYDIFDSTMPTRDARHGRLYAFRKEPKFISRNLDSDDYTYVYIQDKKYVRETVPVSEFCDCACCSRYSLAYLHHLFNIGDSLYQRLATIHNLRFMAQLMGNFRNTQD